MPEEAIAPPPPGAAAPPEYVPPQEEKKPEPLKVRVGDKYREALDKLAKTAPEPKEVSPKEPVSPPAETDPISETPKEEPKVEAKPEEKPEVKPESPLDVVAKKEEPKPEEVPDVLKEFDEKTANWQRAREVMKTQSAEVRDLKTKLAELEKSPKADPASVQALQQERDQLKEAIKQRDETIKAINAEYSEDYQKLVAKREDAVKKIANKVRAYGGDADALTGALSLPDSSFKNQQIKAALGEMEPDDKAAIRGLIERFEEHNEAINEYRKDLPKKWDEIQARQQQIANEQQEQGLKQLETEFRKVADALPATTVTLRKVPDDVPGAAEWNKEIDDADARALHVMKPGATFEETAAIARKGARYDSLEARYLQLYKDHVELRKSTKSEQEAAPDFRGGEKPKTEAPKTPAQKYHETLSKLQSSGTVAP